MSQLSYAEQAQAFAGMLADLSRGHQIDTMVQGEVSAEIAFGRFVVVSAAQSGNGSPAVAKLPAAAGDDFANGGVVVHSHVYDTYRDLGTTGIKPKQLMAVMRRGRVWVECEEAMGKADQIFVRHTAGAGGSIVGKIRNDADTASAILIPGARVVQPTTGAGLCQIEVDMNQM